MLVTLQRITTECGLEEPGALSMISYPDRRAWQDVCFTWKLGTSGPKQTLRGPGCMLLLQLAPVLHVLSTAAASWQLGMARGALGKYQGQPKQNTGFSDLHLAGRNKSNGAQVRFVVCCAHHHLLKH